MTIRAWMQHARWLTVLFSLAILLPSASAIAQGESSSAAVQLYRSAVKLQNTGVYELAVDEWTDFLTQHASDPLAQGARHNRGICLFQLGQYGKAIEDFSAVVEQGGDFDQLESTLVNLGLARFNSAQAADGDEAMLRAAIDAFAQQLQKFSDGKHAPLARFYGAESLYLMGRRDPAIAAYRKFLDAHAEHALAPRALYGLGVAQAEATQHDAAQQSFEQFLQRYADHEFAAEVQMRLGDALFTQGNHQAAAPYYERAAAADGFEFADYSLLQQAACLFETDEFLPAARLYANLVQQHPDSHHKIAAELNAGKALLRAGESEKAAGWFRNAARGEGEHAIEAAHWLARAQLTAGDASGALATVDAAMSKSPTGSWAAELILDRADALYALPERQQEAQKVYSQFAASYPQHSRAAWALYSAADVALSRRELADARALANEMLQKHAESEHAASAEFVLAEADRLESKHAESVERIRRMLARYGQHTDHLLWRNRLALNLLLSEQTGEVVLALGRSIDEYPEGLLKGEAQYLLGTAHLQQKEYAEAMLYLADALETEGEAPFLVRAQLNMARAQHAYGATSEARQTLVELIKETRDHPVLPEAVYRLGSYQAAAGEHAAAVDSFRQLLNSWPEDAFAPHAYYAMAASLRTSSEQPAARDALDKLLTRHGDHSVAPQARLLRASVFRELGDHEAAIRDVDQLLTTTDSGKLHADALYLRGLCLAGTKQFDEAAAEFDKLLQAYPNYESADRAIYEMAWAHQDAGRDAEARAAFAALADRYSDSELVAEAAFRVGESLYAAEDYSAAAQAYEQAVTAKPDRELAEKILHKQAWCFFQQKEFEQSAAGFARQVQLVPQGSLATDAGVMHAESLFQQKKYDEALTAFKQILPASDASGSLAAVALLHAGQAAAQQKEWQQAAELLQQGLQQFADSAYGDELEYELSWAKYNLGQPDEAEPGFAAVAQKNSGVLGARARFMLGEIAMGRKKYSEAIRIFTRVTSGYGAPNSPEEYHAWQSAAMFDAARCLEQLDKLDAAKKLYEELVQRFPEQSQAQHARKRLEEMNQS